MATTKKVRRPSQARSRGTVAAILEATSQVLRREGLEGCTTTKIAERAGVSVGTLYQYFPNKNWVQFFVGTEFRSNSKRFRRPRWLRAA